MIDFIWRPDKTLDYNPVTGRIEETPEDKRSYAQKEREVLIHIGAWQVIFTSGSRFGHSTGETEQLEFALQTNVSRQRRSTGHTRRH